MIAAFSAHEPEAPTPREPSTRPGPEAETFHRLRRTNAGADAFVLPTLAADVRRRSGLLVEAPHLPVETRVLRAVTADGLLEPRRGRMVVLDAAGLAHRGSAGF